MEISDTPVHNVACRFTRPTQLWVMRYQNLNLANYELLAEDEGGREASFVVKEE